MDSVLKQDSISEWKQFWKARSMLVIAIMALSGILLHLLFRYGMGLETFIYDLPLWTVLILGGIPLIYGLLKKVIKLEFGSDLLAGLSIATAVLLGEYLAGAIVVLMLSGGEALESYAIRSASSVLQALAKRMPSVCHRRQDGQLQDVALSEVVVGDILVLFPHDICPVDGVVTEGRGIMDEAFLTGEPFQISKTPGSEVISGAINGEAALTIRATRPATDSRYAKIMQVMRSAEQNRPRMRRLGDTLGAFYTPFAVLIALFAWAISGQSQRFLAVLVVATPCPLLIGIPVAIIGAISLCARRGIIIKNPVVLETIATCRTAIFDKTGTLTYGRPRLTDQIVTSDFDQTEILGLVASLERYSKHPLALAIVAAAEAKNISLQDVAEISEPPGQGMRGTVDGHTVRITSRGALAKAPTAGTDQLPPHAGGLECVVLINERYVALYRFRDEPRIEGVSFIKHLRPRHHIDRIMIVSGDRESEVRYLAEQIGISEIYAQKTPEEKVTIVRAETAKARTLYVGDGINDAPALMSATVGVAIGQNSDITTESAGVVILDSSLEKVDEFMHISARMRRIALQSALGGMALSIVGMGFASVGLLSPVAGALSQEIIDVLAVFNALRTALRPKELTDFSPQNTTSGQKHQ
ncbi:heavy metal translocating P-type ATPase [Schlesneria paludicola]|uniref:heavy metal translocating P-type ATPase n=1 Tax=Schlesneria paludicola TaxID=360056 RepID=UPI0012F7854C|nr:heavy metal translocating P-type ATPase [Schlesneria paludicola]